MISKPQTGSLIKETQCTLSKLKINTLHTHRLTAYKVDFIQFLLGPSSNYFRELANLSDQSIIQELKT